MPSFDEPYDTEPTSSRAGCTCGHHPSQAAHEAEVAELQWQRQLRLQTVAESEDARRAGRPRPPRFT
ncbi:MAG: hypothetical protein KIT16_19115 [Rhodospirillaceae bacterium]|nr:hypothetical protein [Rhodospirillaceae bacterium]